MRFYTSKKRPQVQAAKKKDLKAGKGIRRGAWEIVPLRQGDSGARTGLCLQG